MAAFMTDDYVEYDFSDDENFNSSDDEATGHLEKWLRNKLAESDSKDTQSQQEAFKRFNQQTGEFLTTKELKKLNEKEFEQSMQDALDDLDNLDQPSISRKEEDQINDLKNGSAKTVTFAEESDSKKEKMDNQDDSDGLSDSVDPLYDPDADEEDEKWMENERTKHLPKSGNNKFSKVPKSDAILSCPACMTIVCIDCQRHEFYTNQFRAMFVMNCRITSEEVLNVAEKSKRSKRKGAKMPKNDDSESSNSSILASGMACTKSISGSAEGFALGKDQFHPVKCDVCTTEVAVYDKDEIYHFFNTIASLP